MSRNGSGTYNLPVGNPVVTGTTISTTWANSTLTDIATALTGSLAADGQTPATGNLNMNTNQIKNVVDPTLAQDAATKAYVDAGSSTYLLKASNLSDVANATTSRTNLSAAKSGANSDITSITGLTTPLTVAQGGIGAATLTANNVLLGNGTSAPQVVAPSTTGNVLTSNGTTWVSSALNYVGAKGQVFTTTGANTFTVPTGITAVKVTVIGGGGGLGATADQSKGGGGGGGGGTAIRWVTGLTPSGTVTVTVGAGGTANGGTGGTSSFGVYASGTGGAGGAASNSTGNGGVGGTGSSGDINQAGGAGGGSSNAGGCCAIAASSGSGGAAIFAAATSSNQASISVSNSGGWGKGGDAVGGNQSGASGLGFGSGASGGYSRSGSNYNGGVGTAGIVIVEW